MTNMVPTHDPVVAPAAASPGKVSKTKTPKPPGPIFVCEENYPQIRKAYPAAPTLDTLLKIIERADKKLDRLCLAFSNRPGVELRTTSGSPVPASYRWPRPATRVGMTHKTKGWYLIEAVDIKISPYGGQNYMPVLWINPDHSERAFSAFIKKVGDVVLSN
jgi:hypothetical protein